MKSIHELIKLVERMEPKKLKVALEIRKNMIRGFEKHNKESKKKGYLDFEEKAINDLIKKLKGIKDFQFWIDNRTATMYELMKILKIKNKAQTAHLSSGSPGGGSVTRTGTISGTSLPKL